MKKTSKIMIGIAVIVAAVLIAQGCLFLYILFGSNEKSTSDIGFYQSLSGETQGQNTMPILGERLRIECEYDLPWLSELEPYEDYRFNYTVRRVSIFESHAYILIVRYEAAVYAQQKETLESAYTYMEENLPGEFAKDEHFPAFEMDGFQFRAVDEVPHAYPHYMLFVGTSDECREVAYIYFNDSELDYISPTVEDFLRDETGWDEVIK